MQGWTRMIKQLWNSTRVTSLTSWYKQLPICICFYGFFKSDKITTPTSTSYYQDTHSVHKTLTIDSHMHPTVIQIPLKAFKMDQATDDGIFQIATLIAYLADRGGYTGHLFYWQDLRPLSQWSFVPCTKQALMSLGYDEKKFAGHSFQAGVASTISTVRFEDSPIKVIWRWEQCIPAVHPPAKGPIK